MCLRKNKNESSKNILKGKRSKCIDFFSSRRVNFFWSGLKKKRDRKSRCFFRLTHKKSLCVCLFAQENKKQRKKISKAIEKKEEKNNCLSSFHTRGLLRNRLPRPRITTTARQRERDGETESFRCCRREEEEEDNKRI